MAYPFKSGNNEYWRVSINRKGHKVDKLFPKGSYKQAIQFENITREAIDNGTFVSEESKLALIPDVRTLLQTYFEFIKDNNTEAVAYKYTVKNKEYKLLKQIPNIEINLPEHNAYVGGENGEGYRFSEKPRIEIIDPKQNITETYYKLGSFYIDTVDTYVIERYVASRKEAGLKDGSVHTEIIYLRQAFRLANRLFPLMKSEDIFIKNPFEELTRADLPRRSPPRKRVITQDQLTKITNFFSAKANKQYLLAFKICLTTGLRKNECLSIDIENIDIENRIIYIPMTKNGSDRKIFIENEVLELLPLVQEKRTEGKLFSISQSAINMEWYRCFDDADKKERPVWHMLKSTAISTAVKQNGLIAIAEKFKVSVAQVEEFLQDGELEEYFRKKLAGEAFTDKEVQKYIGAHKSTKMTQRYYVDTKNK